MGTLCSRLQFLWTTNTGVGAQGGNLDAACEAALDPQGLGLIIPVSRGISREADPGAAAAKFRDMINSARVSCIDVTGDHDHLRDKISCCSRDEFTVRL